MHENARTVDVSLRALLREPLFRAGLVVRLLMVAVVVPAVQLKWFVPFLRSALHRPSFDPWSAHLAAGGDPMAFPYGPVMYLIHLPPVLAGAWIDEVTGLDLFAMIGFGLTILLLDIGCLGILTRLLQHSRKRILAFYWMSPIVLYICYWHGQTDMVPVFLLLTCLLMLERKQYARSGAALGCAIAAKLSMILPAPLLLIYFLRNKRIRPGLHTFSATAAGAATLLQGPYFFSAGVQRMVLQSPEIEKIYRVAISMGDQLAVYILPLTYLLLLYAAWRIGRMNFQLLFSFLGICFFLVLLLTPASIGWFLWTVPFLVAHQITGGRPSVLLVSAFFFLLIGFHLANSAGAYVRGVDLNLLQPLLPASGKTMAHLQSLWLTLMTAVGGVLALRMLREGIQRNDYYRLSRRPLCIGIAGDSGTGKDTFVRAIAGLFGEDAVAHVSGDDYHLWDRHAPMWRALTHLNPQANDLMAISRDVLALLDKTPVLTRHYDHKSGRFHKATATTNNDIILVSGLHSLAIPALLPRYDLRLYLDMAEPLRRFYKTRRDVLERGHAVETVLESLDKRHPDAVRFIHPQSRNADLVFALQPVDSDRLSPLESERDPELCLVVTIRRGVYAERLVRILIGLCGLHVDMEWLPAEEGLRLRIEGDLAADDVAMAAAQLIPHMDELLAAAPGWQGAMIGVMQLIALIHLSQAMREKVVD